MTCHMRMGRNEHDKDMSCEFETSLSNIVRNPFNRKGKGPKLVNISDDESVMHRQGLAYRHLIVPIQHWRGQWNYKKDIKHLGCHWPDMMCLVFV